MRNTFEPKLQYSFIAAGGLILGAGISIYSGIKQKQQADQIEKNNPYPTATPPQAAIDNQQYAKQAANEGLPSQIIADSMKELQRNQTLAIRTARNRRAGGLIGPIAQGTNDAIARLRDRNAMAQQQNQRALYGVNANLAKYQQSANDWNTKNRYNQQYNYQQQLLGASNQNIVHGIDAAGSAIVRGAGNGLFSRNSRQDPGAGDPNYYGTDPLGPGPNDYMNSGQQLV